jgi:4-hydroxybenzoate polyprenyltransferase
MQPSRLLAFAQLLRLPNVFTAFADICMAACAAGYITSRPGSFALMLLGSGCLYLGGMVWNDFFDRKEDAKTQPHRPIPSGRVSKNEALVLGLTLILVGGMGMGAAIGNGRTSEVGPGWMLLPAGLVLAILLYDGWLKRTVVGPVAMGLCRFLNVLIGLCATGAVPEWLRIHLAGVVGLYIVGVTWFARTEETESRRWQLIAAAGVMAAAVFLAVAIPVHLDEGRVPFYYPYLLAGFVLFVGFPIDTAIREPTPNRVQMAVKRCIFGLVILDAVLATAFVGWPGLLIGLLLLPAAWLGKWVYST